MNGIVHIVCNGAEEFWLDAEDIKSVTKGWHDYRQGGSTVNVSYKDGTTKEFNSAIMVIIEHEKVSCEEIEAEENPPKSPVDYKNDKVDVVYDEIDRLDAIDRNERKKTILKLNPQTNMQFQKKGFGIRFLNACRGNNIETVGQLLDVGRIGFDMFPNIGRNCTDTISEALRNLYGIEKW